VDPVRDSSNLTPLIPQSIAPKNPPTIIFAGRDLVHAHPLRSPIKDDIELQDDTRVPKGSDNVKSYIRRSSNMIPGTIHPTRTGDPFSRGA
jgi:hypothetical protein